MTITVRTPSGINVSFQDGTSHEVINDVMRKATGAPDVEARLRTQDQMIPTIPGTPEHVAQQQELREHNKRATDAEREWLNARGPVERIKDAGAFALSVPVRTVTQGQYGAGDVAQAIGAEGAATSLRQAEQDFVRANEEGLRTMGAVGEVAAGIPALNTMGAVSRGVNAGVRTIRAENAVEDLAAFKRQDVRPFAPAFGSGPMQGTAKQISDTAVIGGPVRGALEESLGGARNAAARVAEDVGGRIARVGDEMAGAPAAEKTGEVLQQGLTRFKDARPADIVETSVQGMTPEQRAAIIKAPARFTSMKTKQAALYERAWDFIPEAMRRGRAVEGDPRVMENPSNTRVVLDEIIGRNARMTVQTGKNAAGTSVARPVQGGLLGAMMDAVMNQSWSANLQTLRDMRSDVRRLASGMGDTERNTLRLSDMERIQSGLSRDMVALLERNAAAYETAGNLEAARNFRRSIRAFRQADEFTRGYAERLEQVERLFNANSPRQLYDAMIAAAQDKSRQSTRLLAIANRLLRPEEMAELRGTLVADLGKPVASARGAANELGFSVQSFTTRYNQMFRDNRAGLELLFPDKGHRKALEDVARISARLAEVEAMANTSRSATNAANMSGVLAAGGAFAAGGMEVLLGSLASGAATSVLLSRPELANWLVNYTRLRAAGQGRANAELARHLATLGSLAVRYPEASEAYKLAIKDNSR